MSQTGDAMRVMQSASKREGSYTLPETIFTPPIVLRRILKTPSVPAAHVTYLRHVYHISVLVRFCSTLFCLVLTHGAPQRSKGYSLCIIHSLYLFLNTMHYLRVTSTLLPNSNSETGQYLPTTTLHAFVFKRGLKIFHFLPSSTRVKKCTYYPRC